MLELTWAQALLANLANWRCIFFFAMQQSVCRLILLLKYSMSITPSTTHFQQGIPGERKKCYPSCSGEHQYFNESGMNYEITAKMSVVPSDFPCVMKYYVFMYVFMVLEDQTIQSTSQI